MESVLDFLWCKRFFESVSGQTLTSTAILLSPTNTPLIIQEGTMREVQLGAHTVRSHGVTVARKHMHDWLLLLLLVLEIILFTIHPFYRFVGKDMMTDLKYPLKSNTVPVWAVPVYCIVVYVAVLLPMVVFIFVYFRRRDVYDLHHAILGLFFSVLITAVMTDAIKDAVGRPRPDFFWRCFPDGKDFYDALGNVICHGDKSVIREGHKSFPSGHTSCKLHYTSCVLCYESDDVFAGGLLGLVIATFCYLQFFPPPYHSEGWGPFAYFKMLEESGAITSTVAAANIHNGHVMQTQSEGRQDDEDENNRTFMGLALTGRSNSIIEDVEAGRRY